MKKYIKASLCLLAAMSLSAACNKENEIIDEVNPVVNQDKQVSITVSLANDLTKVALTQDSDADGSVKLTWAAGDQIRVASHDNPSTYADLSIASGVGEKTATFTGSIDFGGPFDISYNSAGDAYNYAEQTQSADANTEHLKYIATLSNVNTYENVDFTEDWAASKGGSFTRSSVLRLRAQLPAGIAAKVKYVTIKASENCFDGGDAVKVTITTPGDAETDGIINVFATLPASAYTLAADATIDVIFETNDHDIYRRALSSANVGGKSFAMGQVNAFKLNCISVTPDDFAGGSGVDGDPWLIGNARQMQKIAASLQSDQTKYFKLIDDINMSGKTWDMLNKTSPYNKYVNIDGNFKTISNLAGTMFSVFKGTVQNLTFDGSSVTDGARKGVFAQYIQGTGNYLTNVDIRNVSTFSSSSNECGGMVGRINAGTEGVTTATFVDCDVVDVVVNGGIAGGIIGGVEAKVVLNNCTRTGSTVTNSGDYAGGLIGKATVEVSITGCSVLKSGTTGSVSGANDVGGLAGLLSGGTISNCSVDIDVTGSGNTGGFVGYTSGGDYSSCSSAGKVSGSLNVGGFVGYSSGNDSFTNCGFKGESVSTSTTGQVNLGGFCGQLSTFTGSISGCYVYKDGSTKVNITANDASTYVGGFVGMGGANGNTNTSTIENSYAKVNITSGQYSGGFAGALYSNVSKCKVISSSISVHGNDVGGFAGYFRYKTISNCYTTMNVDGGSKTNIGGFVGTNRGTINNCYASGTTSCTGTNKGSFVGQNNSGGNINNCITKESSLDFYGANSATIGTNCTKNDAINTQATTYGWNGTTIWNLDVNPPTLR